MTAKQKLNEIVSEIDEQMESVYQTKPHWRPNLGVRNEHPNLRDRPFNYDCVDDEYERIQDQEFRWEEK